MRSIGFKKNPKMFFIVVNTPRVRVMVFSATFNNISVISWRSVLLLEETGVINPTTIQIRT